MEPVNINIDDLNERQYEIAEDIINTPPSETKFFVLRASRQSGKTFLLNRLLLKFSFSKPNLKGCMVSASFIQFNKLWRDIIELTPPALIREINKYINLLTFSNGTSIQFFTARNYESIKGNTFDFLLCDEVALYPLNSLEFITPVLDARKNSKGILVSTPMGKNDFYKICMQGLNERSTFVKHYKMSYLDNPNYDIRSVNEKRKTMVDAIFKSEYLAEFVFGFSSVFGEFKQYQLVENWIEPQPNEQYFGAIDVAGGGDDSTILTIINEKAEVVFIYECKSGNIPEQVDELAPHINRYNNAFVKGECNGLGLGLVEMLQLKCQNVTKFWMTNQSKNDLVSRAKKALFNKTLILPSIDLYPKLDNEMTSYIVTRTSTGLLTYRHENGLHDDTVDSMLIANYQREIKMAGPGIEIITEDKKPEEMNYFERKEMMEEPYDDDDDY